MARKSYIYHGSMLLLFFGCSLHEAVELFDDGRIEYMSREERETLKEEAKDMFYHAYNAYMDNAYPADELMPLSCKGRYRGSEPDRGDIDSTLGNFSLTLVDTLDTLVVIGDLEEFENAVKLVIKDVTFDTDVIVSLFETNIRMLGGLLSGHILADYIQQRGNAMSWYRGELLNLAKDLGYRFLPAFNTSTGIPFGRINLRYGMKGVPLEMTRETCTACAGSMILEMAALSRLTGESVFEEKAQKAMDVLWKLRHRGSDLMGSVLNVNSGDWVRRDSGVGAGIDSYYEYCLKAYILLGDEKYLGRFNKHYQAIMKYISQGPMLLDVHMHRPNTNSKNFMDALLAFWPGVQVLKGDIKPAVETHEMLYQVMQRHNFIPEAFTTDFQVHWGHHPLRPEFLESTYFLYKATGDHYYLGVGRKVLKSLQTYARVSCGFAAVSDVRTNKHDDTMDSFVLSETFKYLYLLFADPSDLLLDLDEYVFTTEGHLLPLSLASVRTNLTTDFEREKVHVEETDRTCPNSLHLFPASVRQPLRNMVEDVCPKRVVKKRLSASQFQPNNLEHSKMLSDMGITILTLVDGSVQLLHTFSNAKTPQDAEEGLLFMQEMVELSKSQTQQTETKPVLVTFVKPNTKPPQKVTLLAGPAHFGADLKNEKITGKVILANPSLACQDLNNANSLKGMIVIVDRGSCMFVDKARRIQKAGAIAGIVLDNVPGSNVQNSPMFAMSGDGKQVDDVTIPFVFLFSAEASQLLQAIISAHGSLIVTIGGTVHKDEAQLKAPTDLSMFERLKGTIKEILTRQLTSQNLPSGGTINDVAAKSLVSDQEQIAFGHLRAFVMGDSPDKLIKININPHVREKNYEPTQNAQINETNWTLMKKMIVNELFGTIRLNLGFVIESTGISKVYSLIMGKRGMDEQAISNAKMSDKVLWFLKELSEIQPDPSIVALYFDLFPEVNKQYFLSYLFRSTAFNIKKFPDLIVQSGAFSESFITQLVILFTTQTNGVQSAEFGKFMKKYLPIIIRYIIQESLNVTSNENWENNIFSINEFITANKEHVVNINPSKIFEDKTPAPKKQTAEVSSKKKGVIQIEVATPPAMLDERIQPERKLETDNAESNNDKKSKNTDGASHVQSSSRRTKGDDTEDFQELNENANLLRNKDKIENQENIEESVPNTPVKDLKHSNSVTNNGIPSMKEKSKVVTPKSASDRQTVSSEYDRKHAHDDL
ncbi:ER degradation-enhancing alpha-mannosidase-like protein 3 [Nasonia vitripennis]|uniref:alpha-1,2-Mannosidase n=1 Tax=Nasonia vitripennis TaxID=7425 RepID=A0A7M7T7M3_NASVI|nr:ER degradation-enhancing alpha-mannosidase-like protein 3 [Nasonia vitripennis]XP_031780381.1 ER degradation-enhancing alpha-mannosidase-like protein 3 [Nasonia vitripennis]XP_031780382.1 ER degradation-enhancing alpha-mannosidase-like protein 3 [Nasonia vitripennis]XP_031780383.1 ER degradation-enhancing alpha-mannosidase-like protein 3 [Nasonia vitripennis]XP_031780384.1 ER degradation-enhancing alpha-mannosidase-like protein 3 [Nasonia vitripennis]XP_031780385.1 ER degradation-enhancing 